MILLTCFHDQVLGSTEVGGTDSASLGRSTKILKTIGRRFCRSSAQTLASVNCRVLQLDEERIQADLAEYVCIMLHSLISSTANPSVLTSSHVCQSFCNLLQLWIFGFEP